MCGGDPISSLIISGSRIVFPTCVGVIPSVFVIPVTSPSIPHMCEGDPVQPLRTKNEIEYSPRM